MYLPSQRNKVVAFTNHSYDFMIRTHQKKPKDGAPMVVGISVMRGMDYKTLRDYARYLKKYKGIDFEPPESVAIPQLSKAAKALNDNLKRNGLQRPDSPVSVLQG